LHITLGSKSFRADDEAKITEGDGCWIGVL
jgi:hypothetical protein